MKKFGKILLLCIRSTILLGYNQTRATDDDIGFSAVGLGYIDGVDVLGTDNNQVDPTGQEPRLIQTVKTTINRILGILGLIALILCLRGGFQMLTAAGDESKVKSGTKVLKHAAIGLVVIGLSRLFVSFIFRLINQNAVTTP